MKLSGFWNFSCVTQNKNLVKKKYILNRNPPKPLGFVDEGERDL